MSDSSVRPQRQPRGPWSIRAMDSAVSRGRFERLLRLVGQRDAGDRARLLLDRRRTEVEFSLVAVGDGTIEGSGLPVVAHRRGVQRRAGWQQGVEVLDGFAGGSWLFRARPGFLEHRRWREPVLAPAPGSSRATLATDVDLSSGGTDALVAVLAGRLGTELSLTLDRRRFDAPSTVGRVARDPALARVRRLHASESRPRTRRPSRGLPSEGQLLRPLLAPVRPAPPLPPLAAASG